LPVQGIHVVNGDLEFRLKVSVRWPCCLTL